MYQREWETLKVKGHGGSIRISAPSLVHRRVYKAIIKEKDSDVMYKYELSEQGKVAILSKRVNGLVITISLTIKDSIRHYKVSDLF